MMKSIITHRSLSLLIRIKQFMKLSTARFIVLMFALIIFIGAILLNLPLASRNGQSIGFLDALFTATTSTCVTGLVVVDTYSHWTLFGQIVILCLVQIGGLGFMTIATLVSLFFGRSITLRERMLMAESMNQDHMMGIVRLSKHVLIGTLLFEFFGACLLMLRFIPEFGVVNGIYKSIFHSVSAFCNAGLDLMGQKTAFSSLTTYAGDLIVNLTVMILIVVGGLGFSVWEDVLSNGFRFQRYRLHTKLALGMTGILLVFGWMSIFAFEYHNPDTIGSFSFGGKVLASAFQSVTSRTAGFNTLHLNELTPPSLLITKILMFIGGSPGSTAGGIKTVTMAVLLASVLASIHGTQDVNIGFHRIPRSLVYRSVAIFMIGCVAVIVATLGLMVADQLQLEVALFEAISAFATVGETLGITPYLSSISKCILMALMFFGRVGVMTLTLALALKRKRGKQMFRFPEQNVMVG